jgi:hypothetical protein
MCACSEAFHSLHACAVLVIGVAGNMPIHSMGTACFVVQIGGTEHILEVHNCLLCHGEDGFNLLSVSQLLRAGENEVVFSQDASRIVIQGKARNQQPASLVLNEVEGLYEVKVTPLYPGDEKYAKLPRLTVTRKDDPGLWTGEKPLVDSEGRKAPSKLGVWYCRMLWTTCRVGLQGIKSAEYEDNLQEFCASYFVPPLNPQQGKHTGLLMWRIWQIYHSGLWELEQTVLNIPWSVLEDCRQLLKRKEKVCQLFLRTIFPKESGRQGRPQGFRRIE